MSTATIVIIAAIVVALVAVSAIRSRGNARASTNGRDDLGATQTTETGTPTTTQTSDTRRQERRGGCC